MARSAFALATTAKPEWQRDVEHPSLNATTRVGRGSAAKAAITTVGVAARLRSRERFHPAAAMTITSSTPSGIDIRRLLKA
jgi:hypothetical protein